MIRTRGRGFHHADLDRAGLAAEPRRASGDAGRGEIEILERIAGRMRSGDIQGLEIVPLVLDFRSRGNRKAQPAHDVLELFDGKRQRVQMAPSWSRTWKRGVAGRGRGVRHGSRGNPLAGGGEGVLDGRLGFVEGFSGRGLVRAGHGAELLLHGLQTAALGPQELDPPGFQRIGVGRRGKGTGGGGLELFELGDEFGKRHDC